MTKIICEDAPAAIQATGIEVLLVDQLEPAGETVAEYLNIPFICVSCCQAIHRDRLDIPPFFTRLRGSMKAPCLQTGDERRRKQL